MYTDMFIRAGHTSLSIRQQDLTQHIVLKVAKMATQVGLTVECVNALFMDIADAEFLHTMLGTFLQEYYTLTEENKGLTDMRERKNAILETDFPEVPH